MKINCIASAVVGLVVLVGLAPVRALDTADVKVLCSTALKAVMEELAPQFEKASKSKLIVTYGTSAGLKGQIDGGEAFDLAVLTPGPMDALIKAGKIAADTRTSIARTGMAIGIKKGAHKPDIKTTDALKHALMDAKSIAYAKEGAAGVYFLALVQKLGIADAMKAKSKVVTTGEEVGHAIEAGDAEFGILPVSEILPYKGAEVLGQFPADVQEYAVAIAAVGANAKQVAAAKELIKFLTTPAALTVIKKKGMERG